MLIFFLLERWEAFQKGDRRAEVQRLGAHWDALRSRYYVPAGVGLAAFAEWREYPPKHGAST